MPGTHMICKAIEAYSWFALHVMLRTPGWSLPWPRIDQQGWPMIHTELNQHFPLVGRLLLFHMSLRSLLIRRMNMLNRRLEPKLVWPLDTLMTHPGYLTNSPHQPTSPIWPRKCWGCHWRCSCVWRGWNLIGQWDNRIHILIVLILWFGPHISMGCSPNWRSLVHRRRARNRSDTRHQLLFVHQLHMLIWGQVITQDDLPHGAID